MPEHDVIPLGEIHRVVNWEYANAAARLAATGFIAADVGKWARQTDDDTYWELKDESPIAWALVGGRIPQVSKSVDYTLVLENGGCHIYHPVADDNPRTWTIPANSSVAFPVGTAITFVNDQNTITIAITTDALAWAQDGSTGSRILAENGIATALKVTATRWLISGTGLS